MQDPLKQGLKHHDFRGAKKSTFIRMQDPLKQGLKQHTDAKDIYVFDIRMQDPLKQGLKHLSFHHDKKRGMYSNARSTKTRIETRFDLGRSNIAIHSNARSTKTRIETRFKEGQPLLIS
jgi:hypothetical protein